MKNEQEAVTKLLMLLQEINSAVQVLTRSMEQIVAEQKHAALALGETGLLLRRHAEAIATLWRQSGLPIDETVESPTSSN